MKQFIIMQRINNTLKNDLSVDGLLLIGSFARGDEHSRSDLDYQLIASSQFDNQHFLHIVQKEFSHELNYYLYLQDKKKWRLFFDNYEIIVEIFICHDFSEIDTYYLGSHIKDISKSIVLDKIGLASYLQNITTQEKVQDKEQEKEKMYNFILNFQNRFESCSTMHARSDGYKLGVLFSHALHSLVKIIYMCEEGGWEEYMPSHFLTDYSYKMGLGVEVLGTMDPSRANQHKAALLALFYQYLPKAIAKYNLPLDKNAIQTFLDAIMKRDYFWNFRDLSKFNTYVASNIIYRSSALCLMQDIDSLTAMLDKHNISTIIDLRSQRELDETNYPQTMPKHICIIHAPFDPWSQSIEFQNTHNQGSHAQIAYQFFALECKPSIKIAIEAILNAPKATIIHCHAGKDRTGILLAILHLLTPIEYEHILFDYKASLMDTSKELLQIPLDIIEQMGGIEAYLYSCEVTQKQIKQLRTKLLQGTIK